MKGLDVVVAEQALHNPLASAAGIDQMAKVSGRVRVAGKFFARDAGRFRVQGVTYSPFAANDHGQSFPALERVRQDFALMKAIGINSIRTYHVPPHCLLDLADEIDIPWPKHLCFLDSHRIQEETRQQISQAADRAATMPVYLLAASAMKFRPIGGFRKMSSVLVDDR